MKNISIGIAALTLFALTFTGMAAQADIASTVSAVRVPDGAIKIDGRLTTTGPPNLDRRDILVVLIAGSI